MILKHELHGLVQWQYCRSSLVQCIGVHGDPDDALSWMELQSIEDIDLEAGKYKWLGFPALGSAELAFPSS